MILAGSILRGGIISRGWVEIGGSEIERVGFGRLPAGSRVEEVPGLIAPGLVDLQVNGSGGFEVTGGREALEAISALQLDRGVTAFLPTIITTTESEAESALDAITTLVNDPGSPIVGAHLEGPFLSRDERGVHRGELLREPADGVPGYYRHRCVRLVTLAPELPGALELCRDLNDRGVVVSLGHSAASAEIAAAAAAAGAGSVTHLFNAMGRLHHREPGLAAWALGAADCWLCVIADGHHVDPIFLRIVARCAEGRVVLVSDASVAALAGPGTYRQAGVEVIKESDGRTLTRDGGLAGSGFALDEVMRRWMRYAGVGIARAVEAASVRPARLIGLKHGLACGRPADLVVVDCEGHVLGVMKRGRWVRKPEEGAMGA